MGIRNRVSSKVVGAVAPDVHKVAPHVNRGFIQNTLRRAIAGVGPLPSAPEVARKHLEGADGDVADAIRSVVRTHASLAAGEGFLANLGGIVTAPATIPANIAGLALLQCRMSAAIAHLGGHDLDDPRVQNAVLLGMLGDDHVRGLVKRGKVPGSPRVVATAPVHDPELDTLIAGEVTSAMVNRIIGKRAAGVVVRRIPLAGSVWGGSADAFATWGVGKYVAEELASPGRTGAQRPRSRR